MAKRFSVSIELRPCQPIDMEQIIPIMFSVAPKAFRYVFFVNYKGQTLDFLRYAFCQGGGRFGYKGHQLTLDNGKVVLDVAETNSRQKA